VGLVLFRENAHDLNVIGVGKDVKNRHAVKVITTLHQP